MADPKDRELTDKEKALVALGGKDPRVVDENNDDLSEEEKDLKVKADAKILANKEAEDKLKLENDEKSKNEKKVETPELSDTELLALASKRAGREIKSWDELKPPPAPEDKRKLEDARDANKLSYGLQKGLFNKNTYESFIADSKDRVGLVYRAELEDAKKDDPTWDEEKEKEFKAEFEENLGLDLDPTSAKYKRGQKKIAVIADSILKSTYASIYNLDGEFDKYESGMTAQQQEQQKVLTEAPVFKQDVEDVLAENSTVSISLGGEKFDVPVSKEAIQATRELLFDEKFVTSQIIAGHKKENIVKIAQNLIKTQYFDELIFEAAKQYRAKHEKGTRGIPEGGRLDKPADDLEGLSENQKKALSLIKGQMQIAN